MSGGSGGMPAASNKGQQMQNPQMGQTMGSGPNGMLMGTNPNMMGGQMPPYQMAQQMPGPGGMFGSPTGNIMETDQPMAGQPQMYPQAFDQFRQEEMMMGGGRQASPYASPYEAQIRAMQPAMGAGIAALGGQMPMGSPMDYGTPRFPPQGMPTPPPYQPYMGGADTKPTNMAKPERMLPTGGMPPGFRPTSIDGRQLRDMMDIAKRRFMGGMRGREENGLPASIENNLPPSLKRPTQGGYKNFK